MMPTEMLQTMLQAIHPLEAEAMEALLNGWQEVNFKRNELITQAGEGAMRHAVYG